MGKKIISYSLWGNTPMYTIGAIRNAEMAKQIYPDWICRFYIGDDVPEDIVRQLNDFDNTEVIMMTHKENDWQGMFWRFYAVDATDDVDYVIFRDTDSRLSTREREAVLEWMNSGKYFHIMRDHPYHTEAIMGGMWGCKPKELIERINEEVYCRGISPTTDLKKVIFDWLHHESKNTESKQNTESKHGHFIPEDIYNKKGIDQIFLRRLLYPMVLHDSWIQDSYPQYNSYSGRFDYQYNLKGKEINTGFPSRRGTDWNNFVGQVYDENDISVEEYAELLKQRDVCIYMDWEKE